MKKLKYKNEENNVINKFSIQMKLKKYVNYKHMFPIKKDKKEKPETSLKKHLKRASLCECALIMKIIFFIQFM